MEKLRLVGDWTMNSSAVRIGLVYFKPTKLSLRHAQQYLCELHREDSYHPRHLLLHELPKSPSLSPSETIPHKTKVIPLEEVFKIVRNRESANGKHTFQIITSKHHYSFETDTSDEADKWVEALNEELFGLPKVGVTYRYRVKVERSCTGGMPYGDYLLRVYDDVIKLFTANGLLHTKFSCPIKDIYDIKYHMGETMQRFVTLSVKSVKTDSKVRDVLILRVNSALELIKVLNHRRNLQGGMLYTGAQSTTKLSDRSTIKLGDQSTIKLGEQSTIVFPEQNHNKGSDQHTMEGRLLSGDEVSENEKSTLQQTQKTCLHNDPYLQEFLNRKEKGSRSLPRIFDVPSEGQIANELLSESFEKKAPNRQSAFKLKSKVLTDRYFSISDRPPAKLPSETLDSITEDQVEESFPSRPHSGSFDSLDDPIYDRVQDLSAVLTHFNASKKGQASRTNRESTGYVISSLDLANSHRYLQLFPADYKEDNIYEFLPTNDDDVVTVK